MKDSMFAKVLYFKSNKEFSASLDGDTTDELSQAMPYPFFQDDKTLVEEFDDPEDIEVWKVRVTVETVETFDGD
jgi:hypothetical protein